MKLGQETYAGMHTLNREREGHRDLAKRQERTFAARPSATETPVTDDADQDHIVDLQVGQRIRLRRKEVKVSQEALAEALGITFQQVQKYERAANRVSASKLFAIAQILKVPVSYFFEGLEPLMDGTAPVSDISLLQGLLSDHGGLQLARAYLEIPEGRVRRSLVDLARSITSEDGLDD